LSALSGRRATCFSMRTRAATLAPEEKQGWQEKDSPYAELLLFQPDSSAAGEAEGGTMLDGYSRSGRWPYGLALVCDGTDQLSAAIAVGVCVSVGLSLPRFSAWRRNFAQSCAHKRTFQ
jgi:hypothetical protein